MLNSLSKLLARATGTAAARSGRTPRPRRFVPALEDLQNRVVPATLTNGNLYIQGTNGGDVVKVTYDAGYLKVTENGKTQSFALASVTGRKIYFWGYGGNDTYDASKTSGVRSIADGGVGNDTLQGGEGHDSLFGWTGKDSLSGGMGNDHLDGQQNHDWINGQEGNDTLIGHTGNDSLFGWTGNDTLYGGAGDDHLDGQQDHDWINGQEGNDTLIGYTGNDTLVGEDGNDLLFGGTENDVIYAGAGCDDAHGDEGHDSVLGGDDDDTVHGEAGNDLLDGGDGDDHVFGGDNDDYCFGGNGRDSVHGGDGNDHLFGAYLDFSETGPSEMGDVSDWNYDFLYGEAGNDTFWLADQKFYGWWWDKAEDNTSGELVLENTSFPEVPSNFPAPNVPFYWGHLYGTQP